MGQNPNFRGGQNRDSRWGQNQGSRGGQNGSRGGQIQKFFRRFAPIKNGASHHGFLPPPRKNPGYAPGHTETGFLKKFVLAAKRTKTAKIELPQG